MMVYQYNGFNEPTQNTDRITQILQSKAPPPVPSSLPPQFPMESTPFVPASQQVRPLDMFKQQVASGHPEAQSADKFIKYHSQNDPSRYDVLAESLVNDPEKIDPTNAYQMHTKLAMYSRNMPSLQQIAMQDQANIVSGKGTDMLGLTQAAEKHLVDLNAKDALAQDRLSGGSDSATMQMYNLIKQKFPELDEETAIRWAQNKVGTNLTVDGSTGTVSDITGAAQGLGNLKAGERMGEKGVDLQMNPQIAGATKETELGVEKTFNAPKAQARVRSTLAKSKSVINKIDSVSARVNNLSAGWGSLLSSMPTSQAKDLAADIDTIKANLGFDELNEMRQNSPTGGALGQVAVQEIEFLQSVLANLQQSQSVEQLKRNLAEVRQAKIDSDARIQAAYDADFGRFVGGSNEAVAPKSSKRIKYDNQGNVIQ